MNLSQNIGKRSQRSATTTRVFVHVYFLIGFRNRMIVFMDWAWAYGAFNRTARVVVGTEKFEAKPERKL